MITEQERQRRIAAAVEHDRLIEAVDGKRWWYLSFCDGSRPRGTQFLGGVFVQGATPAGAIRASWELRINPGGEVRVADVPEGMMLDPAYINRLLTRAEVEKMPEPSRRATG